MVIFKGIFTLLMITSIMILLIYFSTKNQDIVKQTQVILNIKIDNLINICKTNEKDEKIFEQIREVGNEYGATTGRKRQIAWNNLDDIIKAARINGVTHLVVNKIDVLEKVGVFKIYHEGIERSLVSKEFYQIYFTNVIKQTCPLIREIIFSESAEKI